LNGGAQSRFGILHIGAAQNVGHQTGRLFQIPRVAILLKGFVIAIRVAELAVSDPAFGRAALRQRLMLVDSIQ